MRERGAEWGCGGVGMVGGQNVSHPGPGNEDTVFEMRGVDFLSALFLLRRGAAIRNLYGFHPRKKKEEI